MTCEETAEQRGSWALSEHNNWVDVTPATAWCHEAVTLLRRGDIDGAQTALVRAARSEARQPLIPLIEAMIRIEAGEPALDLARSALDQAPRDPMAHTVYARALLCEPGPDRTQRRTRAEQAARTAVRLAPYDQVVLRLNGDLMLQIDPVTASQWLNRAQELAPDQVGLENLIEALGPGAVKADQLLAAWAARWGRSPSARERRAAVEHQAASDLAVATGAQAWLAMLAVLLFHRWVEGWPRWVSVAIVAVILVCDLLIMAGSLPDGKQPGGDEQVRAVRRPWIVLAIAMWLVAAGATVRSMCGPAHDATIWNMVAFAVAALAWLLLRAVELRDLGVLGIRTGPFVPDVIWTYICVISGVVAIVLGVIGLTSPSSNPGAATPRQALVVAAVLAVVCVFCLIMRLRRHRASRARAR